MARKPAQPDHGHAELLEPGDDHVQRGPEAIFGAIRMRPDHPERTSSGTSPDAEKFWPPIVTHVVDRPELRALLTAKLDAPVTLVAAAAGWGKTLLAASWVAAGAGDRAVAWVSLDQTDDDPKTFWRTVATGLTQVAGTQAPELRQVIAGDVPAEDLPGTVVAGLRHAPRPIVLVLDNLHEIVSPQVHSGLVRLVERPLPALSLLVNTRRDPPWPLPRLRLAGLVTEVREANLAFTPGVAAELFAQLEVDVDDAQLQRLVDRTEGWPAGLRLIALHLKGQDDLPAAIAAFSGDDHSVAGYLITEVLDQQPPERIAFLEKISVVDLVCADLADALTGEHDGAAMLADLAASHLFVLAVGPPGRWYRLHRLIADILRVQPSPRAERRDLHRRAAEWFRRNGMPLEAIASAVAGRFWPLAADLAGAHTVALTMDGRSGELERVLMAIPRTVLDVHAELAAALAATRVSRESVLEVTALLEHAGAAAGALSERRAARVGVLLDLSAGALARRAGDWESAVAAFQRVPVDGGELAALDIVNADMVPVFVSSNLGAAAYWAGDLATAERHLAAAADVELSDHVPAKLNAMAYSALLRCERGELDTAQAAARDVIAAAASAGLVKAPQLAGAYLTMARVALDRGVAGDADEWLSRLAEVAVVAPEPHLQLATAALLAMRREAAGEHEAALAALRMQEAVDRRPIPPGLREWCALIEAALLARSDDFGAVRHLLEQLPPPGTDTGRIAVARLYLFVDDVPVAVAMRSAAAPAEHVRARVDEAVLDAMLATAVGDERGALERIEDALAAAAPWTMRRPFLVETPHLRSLLQRRIELGTVAPAFAVDLLERMSGSFDAAREAERARIDPLTERELTVLRYLASTLPNSEIAGELYVSVSTVKTHQRSLYRKLGVSGRREAVRRARHLQLL
ncbi:MAG TPA: LuxR C-terminal-related transcriptional regulator [Pseudonocardia sp.]